MQMSCKTILPGGGGCCGTPIEEQPSLSGRRAPAEHSEPLEILAAANETEIGAALSPEKDCCRVMERPSLLHSHPRLACQGGPSLSSMLR